MTDFTAIRSTRQKNGLIHLWKLRSFVECDPTKWDCALLIESVNDHEQRALRTNFAIKYKQLMKRTSFEQEWVPRFCHNACSTQSSLPWSLFLINLKDQLQTAHVILLNSVQSYKLKPICPVVELRNDILITRHLPSR